MKKIKKWFIDDINFHLIATALVALIDLLAKPSLGQFGLQLFGYFATYFFIKILSGGKKMSEIPWEDNIRNFNIGAFNKNSITVNSNAKRKFNGDINDFEIFDKVEKKSKWQEKLESLSKEMKEKYEPEDFTNKFERSMKNKDLNNIISRAGANESSVTINGKRYSGRGSISIINGKVKIGGKNVTDESKCENLIVEVRGDLKNLTIDGDATCIINGNIKGNVSSHNLDCGNVNGNVNGHKIKCGHIGGNVNAHKVTRS